MVVVSKMMIINPQILRPKEKEEECGKERRERSRGSDIGREERTK